jgi:type IV pilus assembly protein PilW
MMTTQYARCRCGLPSVSGLSLVELLVAMLLGVMLSAGMVAAYLGAKQNSYYDLQMARMQENGRYAMRLLSRELVMAGFFAGVKSLENISVYTVGADCSDQPWILDGRHSVEMVNDYPGQSVPVTTRLTHLTCLDGESIAPGTDLLAVKRTAGEASLNLGSVAKGLTGSTVQSWYLRLESGEPQAWEKIAPVDLRGRAGGDLSESYWKAISRLFFIRSYSDSENRNDAIPTLCMKTIAGDAMTSRCLVEGVENMQFEFGIDTDADGVPNRYTAAPSAEEMRHAVGAKVYLLLRSINSISGVENRRVYALGQKVLTARNDAYLRRVLSATVLLRNHVKPLG